MLRREQGSATLNGVPLGKPRGRATLQGFNDLMESA